MSGLRIEKVQKAFGATEVLKDINIEIAPGEFLILVGPSGCGKSTLLNIIAGLETATAGRVCIGERDVTSLSPKDRDIAMVFQSYALYPNMTVRKNISFGMEIRKVDKATRKKIINRVAAMLQIEPLLDRKPSQLSGGQRQRVAMGRALARDPSIFLFDEPLSNLDAKLRVEMRTEIKELHQRMRTTIVYVTHDQIEAMTLGDRIAVMHLGKIQQFGSPQEVYNDPVNLFVAGFMGSPSMNFIPCRVVTQGGENGILMQGEGNSFTLPVDATQARLTSWLDREVILGIRPEQICNRSGSQQAGEKIHAVKCKVDIIEPTGPDTLIFIRLNGKKVVCRSRPEAAAAPAEMMELMFDMSKALFFDPHTEERII